MKDVMIIIPPIDINDNMFLLSYVPPIGPYLISKNYDFQIDVLDLNLNLLKNLERLFQIHQTFNKISSTEIELYLKGGKCEKLDELVDKIFDIKLIKDTKIIIFSVPDITFMMFAQIIARRIRAITKASICFGGYFIQESIKERDFVDYIFKSHDTHFSNLLKNKVSLEPNKSQTKNIDPTHIKYLNKYGAQMDGIIDNNLGKNLVLPYTWSWGCKFNCSFCSASNLKNYLQLSPTQILSDLKGLVGAGCSNIILLNQSLDNDLYHTGEVCEIIIENKLDLFWSANSSFRMDPKILPLLRKSGCMSLSFGLESGSEKILKKMRKGINVKKAEKILKQAHELGFWNSVSIITGFPHETEEDFQLTKNFLDKNKEYIDKIFVSDFHIVRSHIYEEPSQYGIVIKDNLKGDFYYSNNIEYSEENGLSSRLLLLFLRLF